MKQKKQAAKKEEDTVVRQALTKAIDECLSCTDPYCQAVGCLRMPDILRRESNARAG